MTFKDIKDFAFKNLEEGFNISPEEYVFVLAVRLLYRQYEDGTISKETANRIMRYIKGVFEKVGYVSEMSNMVGKTVKCNVEGSTINGKIRAVRLMEGNNHSYEVVSTDTNTVYTVGKDKTEVLE